MHDAINSRALTITGIKKAVKESNKLWFIAFDGRLFTYELEILSKYLSGDLVSDNGIFVRDIPISYKSFICTDSIKFYKHKDDMDFGTFYDRHAKLGHFFDDALSFATYMKQRILVLDERYPIKSQIIRDNYPEFLV